MSSLTGSRVAPITLLPPPHLHRISAVTALLADIHQAYRADLAYLAELRKRRKRDDPLQVRGGYLYYNGDRLYLPNDSELRTRILQECHDAPTGGHFGKDKTIEQVKRRFYWPGMDKFIDQYVTSCDACQRNKPSQQSPMGPMMALQIPGRPWQWVSIDLITALPSFSFRQRRHRGVRVQADQDGALRCHHHERHCPAAGHTLCEGLDDSL